MTIQFNCPSCNALIAFADRHAGKAARCTTCGQHLIIPSQNGEASKKAEQPEEQSEPIPGFCRAVFIDSWRLFVRPQSATGLVFVTAAVCFKFFAGHTDYSFTMGAFRVQAPTGLLITLAAWGGLFYYYMEIIRTTALDADELPEVIMGGFFGFLWNVVTSLFVFAISLMFVLLPSIIYLAILKQASVVSHVLAYAGLFVFPMAILTCSVGGDIGMVFRPDYLLKPVARAFRPYLIAFALFALAWELQLRTLAYGRLADKPASIIALHLLANLSVQGIAIIAMRSIGLFYRHYSCHFAW